MSAPSKRWRWRLLVELALLAGMLFLAVHGRSAPEQLRIAAVCLGLLWAGWAAGALWSRWRARREEQS